MRKPAKSFCFASRPIPSVHAPARRGRRLFQIEALEPRALLSVNSADDDAVSQFKLFHERSYTCGCPACSVPPPPPGYQASSFFQMASTEFPLADTFKLHSLPGATKRIYLDFDGHFTTRTLWQTYFGYGDIDTPAFSLDANYGSFTDLEKAAIQDIWARVAEDFAPFEVDVTTEDPGVDALINTGGSDAEWGVRVVVGGNGSWMGSAGVAVMGGFGKSDGSPAFAFADQWWKTNPNIVTQCISHEVGHTLGLSHDGPGYYGGHGTGLTSWTPIMGNGDKSLSQWSKGEYKTANNKEDDLAIITTGNGFGYRPDDHGNTLVTATPVSGTVVKGIVERNTDVDVFQIASLGTIKATIAPALFGPNLDVLAEILDATGTVIHSSNPIGALNASFDITVSQGTYYLRVRGTGEGTPLGTGYTNYGSLGQYTVTLQNSVPPPPPVPSLSITNLAVTEGNSGSTSGFVTIALSAASSQPVTVEWAPRDGSARRSDNDYSFPLATGGMATFSPGQTSIQIDVLVTGDLKVEPDESFDIVLTSPQGATLAKSVGTITIQNDDAEQASSLAIAATAADKVEGDAGSTPFTFIVTRSGGSSGTATANWIVAGSGANPANAADFTGGVLPSGTISFAPGETSTVITVDVAGDSAIETDEGFSVTLSAPTGATVTTAEAAAVIRNDDTQPATLALAATAADKAEGDAGSMPFTFTVTRSGGSSGVVMVSWTVAGSGANPANAADFAGGVFPSGAVAFAAGDTFRVITVNVAGDSLAEADEGFSVILANPVGGTITTASAAAVIRNDDALVSLLAITATSAVKAEGDAGSTPFTFTVSRSGKLSTAVSARWTVAGSGLNPASTTDFANRSFPTGIVSFAAGETSKIITVNVAGETIVEGNERFSVILSLPKAAIITTPSAAAVILNDDLAATLAIAAAAADRAEGSGGVTPFIFTVTRSGGISRSAMVRWRVAGSGTTPANASDFANRSIPTGVVSFATGETSKIITVNVAGDTVAEANEGFSVVLFGPTNAAITTVSASAVIRNDDSAALARVLFDSPSPSKRGAVFARYAGTARHG